jgi:hypothetical protein
MYRGNTGLNNNVSGRFRKLMIKSISNFQEKGKQLYKPAFYYHPK